MWGTAKLIDICERITQGPNPKYDGDLRDDLRVLKTKHLYDNVIHYEEADKLSYEAFQKCLNAKLFDGDVLLAIVGQGSINKCNVFQNSSENQFIFTRALGLLRPKKDVLDSFYLKFFLQSDQGKGYVDSGIGGTSGQQVVTTTHLKNIEIPLPALTEQKRIVAILDKAFAAIDEAKAKTEQNLKNARELFDSYLQQVFSQMGDDCEVRTMSDSEVLTMVDGDRGSNYPKKSDFLDEGYCLFLSTKNVRPNGFLFDELLFIDKHRDTLLRKGKLQRNDVIITTRGTIGNLAIYDKSVPYENIRINSGMLILRAKEAVLEPAFLFEIMRSGIVKRQIIEKVSGAAQPQLPIKTLSSFKIPVPKTIAKQQEVVKLIKTMEDKYNILERLYKQKLCLLDELKKSILKKAFSGEFTAKQTEEAVA